MKLGTPLVRLARVDSTMAVARRALEAGSAHPGAVFVAEEQTAGRGRHGRDWLSSRDRGLYLTAVLPGELGDPAVTLAAALAVAEAVEGGWGVPAQVKWPNDLLCGGRKWGGVLAEVLTAGGAEQVLLGVGVNLRHGLPELERLGGSATSLTLAAGAQPEAEAVLRAVLAALERRLDEFARGGFAALAADWTRRSAIQAGDVLELDEGGARRSVTCAGFDGRGRLRVEEDPRPLASAEVLRVRPRAGTVEGRA